MPEKIVLTDQGNIPDVKVIRLELYQAVNNFFCRGGYTDLYNRSRTNPAMLVHSDIALTDDYFNYIFTNQGAVSDVTITLPPALAGFELRIRVENTTYITVMAHGTDGIEGLTIGHGLKSNVQFSLLHLVCCVSGVWDIEVQKGVWSST